MIAGGSYADAFGTAALTANTWSFLTETYDGSTLRLYVNGTQVASTAAHRRDRDLHQPAADRRRQPLRPVLRRADRQRPRLQRRADRRPDPDRPGHPDRRQRRAGHDAAVAAGDADRDRASRAARSICPGAPPPTTSASPATTSSAARAPAARNFTQIAHRRHRHDLQGHDASAPPRATATGSAPPTPPATSAPTPTPPPPSHRSVCSSRRSAYAITPGMTEQYTATVPSGSPASSWSVDGVAGGNATVGTITAAGVYTAAERAGQHTITATSGTPDGDRDRLRHQLPGDVHRPQRQRAHGREPERDGPDAGERELERASASCSATRSTG